MTTLQKKRWSIHCEYLITKKSLFIGLVNDAEW